MASVLVTGAGGFIGSHLTEELVRSGHAVRAFVHYNSESRWGWLDESVVRGDIEVVSGDVRDFDSVQRAMHGCESVFHLAALIGIPYSYVSPLAYIRTNIEGTYNVLEAARNQEASNVVVTSTSETYGSAQYTPIDEGHPKVGQSPYSASKISADEVARSYHLSFELPVKLARPFNTYGPRQSARAFVPAVITQLLSGCEQLELGNLDPTRDLTFVDDTVAGFMALHDCHALIGQDVNIATGADQSMREVVAMIQDVVGTNVPVTTDEKRVRPDDSEVQRLCGDSSKLESHTGWAPSTDLQSGIERTVDWLRAHLERYRSDVYNV
jgi:NAD dependent epimerase/dehydratase